MTADQIVELMRTRKDLVEKEFRASSRGLAVAAVRFTKEKLTEEVYAIPEDRTRAGKKKWRRTGNLRRSEVATVPDPYTVLVNNTSGYSVPRHEAGKPGKRKINPLRVSHWRDELLEVFGPIVLDIRHSTVIEILRAAGHAVAEE